MQKTPQPVKPNIQTLYARILEGIRAQMDEAETLYLKLCQTAIDGMVQISERDSVASCRKIDLLSAQYEERLQSIIQDTMTVYRRPIQVFPVADTASMIEAMETYNAQFEELERILDQLCKENSIPKNDQPTKTKAQNKGIWKSIVNSIDLKKEFKNQVDETASSVKCPASPVAGHPGCNNHYNTRKVQTMNLKPNILICGSNQFNNSDLLRAVTHADAVPEDNYEDTFFPDNDTAKSCEADQPDGKRKPLIRRFVETSVANFFLANELTDLGEEDEEFPDLPMADYVKEVEVELHAGGHLSDNDAKIDVIWFCTGSELSFTDEPEKDFIRSAAGVSNALIIASPTIISNRAEFKNEIDALTALAGSKRVVLAPSVSAGLNFTTGSSGTQYLIAKTKWMYLDSVDAPDEEKEAFEAVLEEYYGDKVDEWQEERDDSLSECIEQAARRANFILGKPDNVSLTDLVGEGIDLLGELIEILRGNTEVEDKPGKTALSHTAELKENIELMIYEIAACYGHAATAHDIELIFRHSKASKLPKDAAAITYAVGQVAKAVYEPGTEYSSKELLAIYREAKDEALQMEFKPFDDENPLAGFDDNIELNEEDLEDGDEPEDSDSDDAADPDSDVHEPADELPDDCRVDDELKPEDDRED